MSHLRRRLGVLVFHGIGDQKSDFADRLIVDLSHQLAQWGYDPCQIAWKPVYWSPVIQPKEDQLWHNLSRTKILRGVLLRRFVISVFGDAVAYRWVRGEPDNMYRRIHREVHRYLQELRQDLGDWDAPLVILAHSMGGYIASNYIWDEQKGMGLGTNPLERMETLSLIITFGCNIPLFTLALNSVESIQFPPPSLSEPLREGASWVNYYDRDDVLGFPLKSLSPSYHRTVSEDVQINVGNFWASRNLLSHQAYWRDSDFIEAVAFRIAELLGRLE